LVFYQSLLLNLIISDSHIRLRWSIGRSWL